MYHFGASQARFREAYAAVSTPCPSSGSNSALTIEEIVEERESLYEDLIAHSDRRNNHGTDDHHGSDLTRKAVLTAPTTPVPGLRQRRKPRQDDTKTDDEDDEVVVMDAAGREE